MVMASKVMAMLLTLASAAIEDHRADEDSFDLLRAEQSSEGCPPCVCPPDNDIGGGTGGGEPGTGGGDTGGGGASIRDDPHIRNLAQESFSVNQPGTYVLLRVPQDVSQPAIVVMHGEIGTSTESSCRMYTRRVRLEGQWFGDKVVHVRSMQRDGEGEYPLSLMIARKTNNSLSESGLWANGGDAGHWTSFADFTADNKDSGLPGTAKIVAFYDNRFGKLKEAQTFQVQVGPGTDEEQKTKINVAQASRQALNVELQSMKRLGVAQVGGLLGTSRHDVGLERLTQPCLAEKARERGQSLLGVSHAATESAALAVQLEVARPSVCYSYWH